ncbi:MAG: hypothetical protein WCQ49_03030 [Candidatus Saccharibacteria bacterium]
MKEQLLQTNQGLRAHLYHNADNFENIETIFILAPGMPNYPEKEFFEPLLSKLQNAAFVVVYYYGYWFSSGKFSIENSANSISDIIIALRGGMLSDVFSENNLPKYLQKINLIGYSFGANPLLNSLKKINYENINNIILAAPLCLVADSQTATIDDKILLDFKKYNVDFCNFIARGYSELIRDDSNMLKTHLQGTNKESVVKIPQVFADKIIVYYGAKDEMIKRPFIDALSILDITNINVVENIGHSKKLILQAISDLDR